MNLQLLSTIILALAQMGLKIWGPDDKNKKALQVCNIIRIFLTLCLVKYF